MNDIICPIVDYYLQKSIENKTNKRPIKIDPLMADPNQNSEEEWRTWFPIDSKITDDQILALEDKIGHKLSIDYILFLKHKHFYELQISEATFCKHPINSWNKDLVKMIFNGYPKEYLIDRGLIPFADWSDWGHLCFDTNAGSSDNNYPIFIWDHDMPTDNQYFSHNFKSLMIKLGKEDKESWGD